MLLYLQLYLFFVKLVGIAADEKKPLRRKVTLVRFTIDLLGSSRFIHDHFFEQQ